MKILKYIKMLVVAISRLWVYYYDDLYFSMLSESSTLRIFKKMFSKLPNIHT